LCDLQEIPPSLAELHWKYGYGRRIVPMLRDRGIPEMLKVRKFVFVPSISLPPTSMEGAQPSIYLD
jgi:hypothetical protein